MGGIAGGATVVGEFVEIDPPQRVVFTWGWEGDEEVPPGSSTVEVTLTRDGDATVLHRVHRDLPAGQGARHMEGWEHFVPRLFEAAAGRDPSRPARASCQSTPPLRAGMTSVAKSSTARDAVSRSIPG